MTEKEVAEHLVARLNEVLNTDPDAVEALLESRVICSQALADHPTVQVRQEDSSVEAYTLGFLGLLNGLVGVKDNAWGYIAANYELVCPMCGPDTPKNATIRDRCRECGAKFQFGRLIEFIVID